MKGSRRSELGLGSVQVFVYRAHFVKSDGSKPTVCLNAAEKTKCLRLSSSVAFVMPIFRRDKRLHKSLYKRSTRHIVFT